MNNILTVKNLTVQIQTTRDVIQPVDNVSFTLARGEIFCLVGESGCGKTMTALSINRLLPNNADLCQGTQIFLDGIPLHSLSEKKMQKIRSKRIGMIFQDPALALNPVLTVGDQVMEALAQGNSESLSKKAQKQSVIELFDEVRIPEPSLFLDYYPHQLSGGMKQRVVIAMALAKSPDLLIADEPTTALDVTTQAQVLNLIKDLNKQFKMAILLITHDLGIVGQMADNVAVMYAGHFIEQGPKEIFFDAPKHPYSKKLFSAIPDRAQHDKTLATIPGQVPPLDRTFPLCRFKDRCQFVFKPCEQIKPKLIGLMNHQHVRCHWYDEDILKTIPSKLRIKKLEACNNMSQFIESSEINDDEVRVVLDVRDLKVHFPIRKGFFKRTVGHVKAVDDVSLTLQEGQTLALVGESGCGKTTVGKAILRLIEPNTGKITYDDKDLLKLSKRKLKAYRSEMQMIFQDPYSSVDPRFSVRDIILEGMIALNIGSDDEERENRVEVLLEQVGLPINIKDRYPHELSGGQRQRVSIARALAVGAQLIICDEPTSALDLSVQAQILNLLKRLQSELVISYLFITHNIGVVNYLADYVAVMYLGRIIEYGPAKAVLAAPKHPYTQALLNSVPNLSKANQEFKPLQGELPSASNPPQGCYFAPRCPKVHARCYEQYPPSYQVGQKHTTHCYLYSPEEIHEQATQSMPLRFKPSVI